LFYLALGGTAAMAAYKAVNTLDSMVGYRDERYREFGWFSARADDIANWIPARLTAALVWLVCLLPGFSLTRSIRITLRDGASQPSPNAGYPEAAVAGALGVQLGGLNYYRGVASEKAKLGDPERPPDAGVFRRLRLILYGVALIAAAGACVR
jgi:adenosylcobinamide-phosphate synthase